MRSLVKLMLMVTLISIAPLQNAFSETDKIFSRLLNEPVSMLHYGMTKLQQDMREKLYKREEFSEVDIYVGYPAKDNRIQITIRVGFFATKEIFIDQCRTLIHQIRDHAGVDLETGKVEFDLHTIYATNFWQWGKTRSGKFYQMLDDKFYLSCQGNIEGSGSYFVSGRLVSNELLLSKNRN